MKRLAAVVAVAIGLACVGPTAVASAGGVGACELLTRKEITKQLGQRARPGDDDLVDGVCQWRLKRSDARAPGQVNTMVIRADDARNQFRTAASLFADSNVAVDGLGRDAFFAPESGVVWVLVDDRTLFYVQGNIYEADFTRITDGLQERLTALAAKAEARL